MKHSITTAHVQVDASTEIPIGNLWNIHERGARVIHFFKIEATQVGEEIIDM